MRVKQHKRQSPRTSPLQFTISSQDRPHTSKLWCNNLHTFWTFEDRPDIRGLLCITAAFIFHFSTLVDSTANQHRLPAKTCVNSWCGWRACPSSGNVSRRGCEAEVPMCCCLTWTLFSTPVLLLIMFVPSLTLFTIHHPFFSLILLYLHTFSPCVAQLQ